jgi:hypothetical protein
LFAGKVKNTQYIASVTPMRIGTPPACGIGIIGKLAIRRIRATWRISILALLPGKYPAGARGGASNCAKAVTR